MKYCVIFNPGSGDGRSKRNLNTIRQFFIFYDMSCDLMITKTMHDAYRFSVDANRKGYHVIVAAGGDGTINQVMNGFYDRTGKRISVARLGVLYTGTSPDFCKSYHIPYKNLRDSLYTIKQDMSTKIKIGKIVFAERFIPGLKKVSGNTDGFRTGYFGCCANIGLGAMLARLANSGIRKLLGDTAGTFLSLLKTLSVYRPRNMICYCDGKVREISDVINLSIGRTHYIASGIKVNNSLHPDDNRFYNLLIRELSLVSFPSCLMKIYSGNKIKNSKTVSVSYNRVIEVESRDIYSEVEFDGDPQGFLPCRIETAEDPLDLITGGNNG